MARKSLRPQLNQIRAWVRQGRTDAWIAHQLEVSASQLRDFRRRHGLDTEGEEPPSDVDLRDEIEAEIEAELAEADVEPEEDEELEEGSTDEDAGEDEGDADGERPGGRRRRRRRRGGRGRGRGGRGRRELEATFDHGETDGYGLWLDPAVKDNPVYGEHWAGIRALKVSIEPDRIVLEKVESDSPGDDSDDD
jgi:transposase-like protein